MGTSAVVMLLVGAVFLWGGFTLAAVTYWRSSRRDAAEQAAAGGAGSADSPGSGPSGAA
jgi:hypothetical protein